MKKIFIYFHPFLKKEFRNLKKYETKKVAVFRELFPDEPIDLTKLVAIYRFQQL